MPLRSTPLRNPSGRPVEALAFKFSTGIQSRYRLLNSSTTLMFATLVYSTNTKSGSARCPLQMAPSMPTATASRAISHSVCDTRSATNGNSPPRPYTKPRPTPTLKKARFGAAVDLKYNITPTIGIRGAYRLIYDTDPIVDIRKDYNVVDAGLDISF